MTSYLICNDIVIFRRNSGLGINDRTGRSRLRLQMSVERLMCAFATLPDP